MGRSRRPLTAVIVHWFPLFSGICSKSLEGCRRSPEAMQFHGQPVRFRDTRRDIRDIDAMSADIPVRALSPGPGWIGSWATRLRHAAPTPGCVKWAVHTKIGCGPPSDLKYQSPCLCRLHGAMEQSSFPPIHEHSSCVNHNRGLKTSRRLFLNSRPPRTSSAIQPG